MIKLTTGEYIEKGISSVMIKFEMDIATFYYNVKFRPEDDTLLKKISRMYNLNFFTFGDDYYAEDILQNIIEDDSIPDEAVILTFDDSPFTKKELLIPLGFEEGE